MEVTLYKRPKAVSELVDIKHVRPEDEVWFKANNIKISMEAIGSDFVVYADCGFTLNDDPDEDPDEVIVLAQGRSCEDTMSDLRRQCEAQIAERNPATLGD